MESQISLAGSQSPRLIFLALMICGLWAVGASAQESRLGQGPQITLRKSIQSRNYEGKQYEGEERTIARGDSLWRILVQEKGVTGTKFQSYVVLIRGLNPQLKNLDVLRLGDTIFIPIRPDEAPAAQAVSQEGRAAPAPLGRAPTNDYQVKAGDHLYQVLREQLGIKDERLVAQYYALTKDLNPNRKNWDQLQEGEIIRLPTVGQSREVVAAAEVNRPVERIPAPEARPVTKQAKVAPPKSNPGDARWLPARENMTVLAKIVEAMGSQLQGAGEEVVVLKDGTVRFDRNNYPVVYNPKLRQKVVLDPDDKIPASLRTKLNDPNIATPVVPMTPKQSLQDAVSKLLAGLGYQALPADRPIVVQDGGIGFEAKGDWIALAPEESNKPQEVYVISLTDEEGEIPEYLKNQLAIKGLHLKDILVSSTGTSRAEGTGPDPNGGMTPIKTWPRDKEEMVDALLLAYGVPFGVAETLSVELRDGLKVETRSDRLFDQGGHRTAIFFHQPEPEIEKALNDTQKVKTLDLEIGQLSSRDVIGKLLSELGDQATYREHRFPAANGADQDRLIVTAWGFLSAKRSLFITDRQVPPALQRFFFEKGLEIVYFQ